MLHARYVFKDWNSNLFTFLFDLKRLDDSITMLYN
jgi:hypothetical protein